MEEHLRHAEGAYSAHTMRGVRFDIAAFAAWCADAGLAFLPAEPATVAAFVHAMAETKAPATVRRYVSSLAILHRAAHLPSPTKDAAVKQALKRFYGADKTQTRTVPLDRALVERMLALPARGTRALRRRALLAVAYDTLARPAELVALRREDLRFDPNGGATLTIRRGALHEGERASADADAGTACPLTPQTVCALRAWVEAAGIEDGLLFPSFGTAERVLLPDDVTRQFRTMAKAAGLTAEQIRLISAHSSRVGAALDMVRHGADVHDVVRAGRWRTQQMVGHYTRRFEGEPAQRRERASRGGANAGQPAALTAPRPV